MTPRQHPADREADHYFEIEAQMDRQTRLPSHALLLVLGTLLLLFGILLCVLPQRDFSPEENRNLFRFPVLSMSTLLDGSLSEGIGDFAADQFPLRNFFVQLKARTELLLGKQESNNVLYGQNGYLIARQEYDNTQYENMTRNLAAIQNIEQAVRALGLPFSFAVVPRSVDVNTSHLPTLYAPQNAHAARIELLSAAEKLGLLPRDLTDPLQEAATRGQAVYYKTDHHWTAEGAYLAYVALGECLGYTPYERNAFRPVIATDTFIGTTQASSGMYWIGGEAIELWRYEGEEAFVTEIVTGGNVTRTLQGFYDMEALATHDEYNVFLGGTNTHIRITNPSREEAPVLVLLKDSFSQSLAPFLARHYDLVLLDPRTYDFRVSGALTEWIQNEEADQVMLLLGIDTLYDSYALRNLLLGLHR